MAAVNDISILWESYEKHKGSLPQKQVRKKVHSHNLDANHGVSPHFSAPLGSTGLILALDKNPHLQFLKLCLAQHNICFPFTMLVQ